MATTFAPAVNGTAFAFENHSAHGHGHSRSGHRKAVPERLRSDVNNRTAVEINSTLKPPQLNGSPAHSHARSFHSDSWNSDSHDTHQHPVSKSYLHSQSQSYSDAGANTMDHGLLGHFPHANGKMYDIPFTPEAAPRYIRPRSQKRREVI